MNYDDGIKLMNELCSEGEGIITPEPSYPNLTIHYPGYKGRGDYRMEIKGNEHPPSHTEVCNWLHNMIKKKDVNFEDLKSLLLDIYDNGTNVDSDDYEIPEAPKIIAVIYWITLQDEINYPQPTYQGRRMPFSRYFESIYCTQDESMFNFEDVLQRCNNRGHTPAPYNIPNAPSFYY